MPAAVVVRVLVEEVPGGEEEADAEEVADDEPGEGRGLAGEVVLVEAREEVVRVALGVDLEAVAA